MIGLFIMSMLMAGAIMAVQGYYDVAYWDMCIAFVLLCIQAWNRSPSE